MAKGRSIGIFMEWSNCEKAINKYPNAVFKGFSSIDDTVHFLVADGTFARCEDIPVIIDNENTKSVADFRHVCTTAICNSQSDLLPTSSPVQSHNDNEFQSAALTTEPLSQDTYNLADPPLLTLHCPDNIEYPVSTSDETEIKKLNFNWEEGFCSFCKGDDSYSSDNVIQCNKCKGWCHFTCTRLPDYMLHILKSSNRKYACASCVDFPLNQQKPLMPHTKPACNTTDQSTQTDRVNFCNK